MEIGGRVAVVTGAAGGIGGALVEELLARGARAVVAADLAAPDVGGAGGAALGRALDVADEAATRALVAEAEAEFGRVDLWFANAGVAHGGGPEADDAVWDRQWRVNVLAHVFAARALLPGWIERGEGHLVTTASMAGILTSLGDAVYATTKHAAVGLAEWLAITYAAQGVRVSCACPGAVDTAMLRAGAGGDAAKAAAMIGGGELLTPAEAARIILDGVQEDRFLILTHPEMQEYAVVKAQQPERWIGGMRKLWGRALETFGGQAPRP